MKVSNILNTFNKVFHIPFYFLFLVLVAACKDSSQNNLIEPLIDRDYATNQCYIFLSTISKELKQYDIESFLIDEKSMHAFGFSESEIYCLAKVEILNITKSGDITKFKENTYYYSLEDEPAIIVKVIPKQKFEEALNRYQNTFKDE